MRWLAVHMGTANLTIFYFRKLCWPFNHCLISNDLRQVFDQISMWWTLVRCAVQLSSCCLSEHWMHPKKAMLELVATAATVATNGNHKWFMLSEQACTVSFEWIHWLESLNNFVWLCCLLILEWMELPTKVNVNLDLQFSLWLYVQHFGCLTWSQQLEWQVW